MAFLRIYLSAGEHSGDMHAANLARALRALDPAGELSGMGGPLMQAAGVRLLCDPTAESTIGFMEVLRNLGRYRRILRAVTSWLGEHRPAVVVWVDFGGFNLALAKECRRLGIPVVCVFSPSAWAYGIGRARRMAETVTELAAVLPFEAEFYRSFGLTATFVGHPLVDLVHSNLAPEAFRSEMGLPPEIPIVALLPGSRRQEVERLLPIMLDASARLLADGRRLQLILPRAPSVPAALVTRLVHQAGLQVTVTEGRAYDVLAASSVAAVASGTATLETALLGIPTVSIYTVSALSILIYRALRNKADRGKRITSALPNLILNREIVPELLQENLSGEALAGQFRRILDDDAYRLAIKSGLGDVRKALGEPGAIGRVAEIVLRVAGQGR